MATTILADGMRNPVTGYAAYGGVAADPTGVNDSTQALWDALQNGRTNSNNQPGQSPAPWSWVGVYLPPGNYLVSSVIVLRQPFMFFGEPSNPPTITLKAGSSFFQTGQNPLMVVDGGYSHIPYDTTWNVRNVLNTYISTNNIFGCDVRDINLTIQGSNPGCVAAMIWACAQQCSMRNMVLTCTSQQTAALAVGTYLCNDPGGGGGNPIINVTCTGAQSAAIWGPQSYTFFRNCTFNGVVTTSQTALNNFVGCTFNNPGGSGLVSGGDTICLDDCIFTSGTSQSLATHYHVEDANGAGGQSTGTTVYYNEASTSGTSALLSATGVIKGSPYANPAYPEAPSTTIDITVGNSGVTDWSSVLNAAFAAGKSVYFPPGTYQCNEVVTMPDGCRMYGAGQSGCSIGFNAQPVGLIVTGNGSQGVVIANLGLFGSGSNTVLQWSGSANSQWLDTKITSATAGNCANFIGSGAGMFENCWWPADNQSVAGVSISSTGLLYLYQFAPEHYTTNPLALTNAQQVYGRAIQFEVGPQGGNPTFMTVSGGSNNNFSGFITSGTTSNPAIVLSASPEISLWEVIIYNDSVLTEVQYLGTSYGSGTGSLEGFIIPSIPIPAYFAQATYTVGGQGTNITSLSLPFNAAQTAGNTNVVAISYNSGTSTSPAITITSVTDSHATYSVGSALTSTTSDSQAVYYLSNIAGGSNTITVNLSGAGSQYVSLRIAEYKKLGALDVHSQASGTGTTTTGSLTTTRANDVVISAVTSSSGVNGPSASSSFSTRLNANPFGSDLEDYQDPSISSVSAPTTIAASAPWIQNMVAFFTTNVWFVTPGGAGSKNGGVGSTGWSNAWAGNNNGIGWASVSPGDTVYLAAGTYTSSGDNIDVAASGASTLPITISAVNASNTTATGAPGYLSSYASNGSTQQVVLTVATGGTGIYTESNNYITINGALWSPPGLPTIFGIKISIPGAGGAKGINFENSSNCQAINVEIAGPPPNTITSYQNGQPNGTQLGMNQTYVETDGIWMGNNVLVSGCKIHDMDTTLKNYYNTVTVEYSYIYNVSSQVQPNGPNGNIPHPDLAYSNQPIQSFVIRYCVFANCVSEGIFFDNSSDVSPGSGLNCLMYGCLLFQGDSNYTPTLTGCQALEVKTEGGGGPQGQFLIYANTFIDWSGSLDNDGAANLATSTVVKNNLFVNTSTSFQNSGGGTNITQTNNGYYLATGTDSSPVNGSSNPFPSGITHPYSPPTGSPPVGTPPATRCQAYPVGYDPTPYVASFQPATGSFVVSKAVTITPLAGNFGVTYNFNVDLNGVTGTNLGAFQQTTTQSDLEVTLPRGTATASAVSTVRRILRPLGPGQKF
jgi:Pectate lyase superfamily protein